MLFLQRIFIGMLSKLLTDIYPSEIAVKTYDELFLMNNPIVESVGIQQFSCSDHALSVLIVIESRL